MASTEGRTALAQGRIVWVSGDLFQGRKKVDMNTKQIKRDAQGNEVQEYGFGLAIPKSELGDPAPFKGDLWVKMHEEARGLYPSGHIPPGFAMKYKDGDQVDDKGVPFAQREGYQGCLVFAITTQLPIRFFKWENGANVQINEGIKCGDYVNVQIMVKAHAGQGQAKPGLYLNPMAVQFVAVGKEIINAPSGDQVFGLQAPSTPVGYVAPAQPPMPPAAGYAQPPGPPAPPQPQAPAMPQPHYAVVPQAHQPAYPPGGQPMHAAQPPPGAPAPHYPPQPIPAAQPHYPQPGGMPPIPGR